MCGHFVYCASMATVVSAGYAVNVDDSTCREGSSYLKQYENKSVHSLCRDRPIDTIDGQISVHLYFSFETIFASVGEFC